MARLLSRARKRGRVSFETVRAPKAQERVSPLRDAVRRVRARLRPRLSLKMALLVYALAAAVLVTGAWAGIAALVRGKPVQALSAPPPAEGQTVAGPLPADTPEPDPIFDFETGPDPVYEPPVEPPDPAAGQFERLDPGETDERVRALQERLMELDYMEKDEPTDFYGFVTKYAVQLFQREFGLQVDGVAGEETLRALYSDQAKPYVVRQGDRGTDVLEMQKRLRELGYLKARAGGTFGEETTAAVKAFQKRNALSDDGVIGSRTREALYSEGARPAPTPKPTPTPTPKPTAKPKPTPTLKPGTTPGPTPKTTPTPKDTPKKATPTPAKTVKPKGNDADALISFAKELVGRSYVRGAKGPTSFDCSGFVYYALKNSGVSLSYMTSGGWLNSSYETISSMSDLRKGDIVCFDGHVGIYMGDGRMIDASSSQGKVRITGDIRENSYWTRHFICAKRVY